MSAAPPYLDCRFRGKRLKRALPDSITPTNHLPRSRGRPMKRACDLATVKKRQQFQLQTSRKLRQDSVAASKPHPMSQLESLPVELIEQIFLQSLEVNLPRASPILARVLAKETIYTPLILFAFFDDNGLHPVEEKLFLPAEYRVLNLEDRIRLQTAILDARWCNFTQLQRCLPALKRLAMVQEWHAEHRRDQEVFRWDAEQKRKNADYEGIEMDDMAILPPLDDVNGVARHFSILADNMNEREMHYGPGINTWQYMSFNFTDGVKAMIKRRNSTFCVMNVQRIPDKALSTPPWTTDKVNFLELLLRCRINIRRRSTQPQLSMSWSSVFAGMENAIAEGNTTALQVLASLWGRESRHVQTTSSGSPVGNSRDYCVPAGLFHLATRQQENSSRMILILAKYNALHCISRDDAVLTTWALHRTSEDDFAKWLLRYMEDPASSSHWNSLLNFSQ